MRAEGDVEPHDGAHEVRGRDQGQGDDGDLRSGSLNERGDQRGEDQIGKGTGQRQSPLRRSLHRALRHIRAGIGEQAADGEKKNAAHGKTVPGRGHSARGFAPKHRAEEQEPQEDAAPGRDARRNSSRARKREAAGERNSGCAGARQTSVRAVMTRRASRYPLAVIVEGRRILPGRKRCG